MQCLTTMSNTSWW